MECADFSSLKLILLSLLFQIFHLEKYEIGFSFSNLMEEAHFLFSTYILLVFDSVLYMVLALYFDKILPGGNYLYLQGWMGYIKEVMGCSFLGLNQNKVWTKRNLLCHGVIFLFLAHANDNKVFNVFFF